MENKIIHTHCYCGQPISGGYGRTSTCCQEHSRLLDACSMDRKKAAKKLKKMEKRARIIDRFLYGHA